MGVSVEGVSSHDEGDWSLEEAEQLLNSLAGVLSARMVGRPGGQIDEIHLLTTREVTAKQTVRNVESALLAQLGLSVDHRKISVARTSAPPQEHADEEDGTSGTVARFIRQADAAQPDDRILFVNHQLENDRPHRIRARVTIEWDGERYVGEAAGTDLPKARLELLAHGLLQAVEALLDSVAEGDDQAGVALSLDGVRVLDAFDKRYVLVGVHALHGRDVTVLAGSAPAEDALERSVIMAALQATDRWVRGRL